MEPAVAEQQLTAGSLEAICEMVLVDGAHWFVWWGVGWRG